MSFGNVFLRAQFAGLVQAAFACRVVLQADKDASSCGSKNRKCVSALPFPFQQCIIGSIFPVHALLNLDISSGLGAPISEAELRIDLIWSP